MEKIKAVIKQKNVLIGTIKGGSVPSPAPVSGGYIISTTETQALTVQQVEGSE